MFLLYFMDCSRACKLFDQLSLDRSLHAISLSACEIVFFFLGCSFYLKVLNQTKIALKYSKYNSVQ